MQCKEVIVWMPFLYERPWGFEVAIKFHPEELMGSTAADCPDKISRTSITLEQKGNLVPGTLFPRIKPMKGRCLCQSR